MACRPALTLLTLGMPLQSMNRAAAVAAIPKPHPQTRVRLCPICSSAQQRIRPFTSSSRQCARMGRVQLPKGVARDIPKQQSMKSRMKGLGRGEMPTDFGIIPMTLIRPANRDLPKLLSNDWRHRLRIEWLWIKTRWQNFMSLLYFLRWNVKRDPLTNKRVKQPLRITERAEVACTLHRQYYTALAEGDMATISEIACDGLARESKGQIDQRRLLKRPPMTFGITRYLGFKYPGWMSWLVHPILPHNALKIVSDRVTPLGISKESLLRQAVVQIKSRQLLDKAEGERPVLKDQIEYVVIQKIQLNDFEENWKIWGTTQPSTLQEIDKMLETHGVESESYADRFAAFRSKML